MKERKKINEKVEKKTRQKKGRKTDLALERESGDKERKKIEIKALEEQYFSRKKDKKDREIKLWNSDTHWLLSFPLIS